MFSVLCPLRVLSGIGIHDCGVVCGLHTGYLCFKPIDEQLGGLAGAHCRDRGHLAPGMITGVKKNSGSIFQAKKYTFFHVLESIVSFLHGVCLSPFQNLTWTLLIGKKGDPLLTSPKETKGN